MYGAPYGINLFNHLFVVRNLILLIIAIIGTVYIFLVTAVEDDKHWFKEFSKKSSKQKHNTFNEFIFSQSALFENYSLKFTESDTLFMEVRFPKPAKRFYAILTEGTIDKLTSMIDTLNLKEPHSLYVQDNLQDGISLKFYFRSSGLTKTIGVYGNEAPTEIYTLTHRLDSLAKSVRKYPYHKKIDFGDLSGIVIPLPPPPGGED